MKWYCLLSFFVFTSPCYSQHIKADNSVEPKALFEIKINGQSYKLSEDEELKLDKTLSKPTITIKLADFKTFHDSAFSFDYPRHLTFEYEAQTNYKNWTFSGNSLIVMVFELSNETYLNDLSGEMIKKFGKENCKQQNFEKQLGHKDCKGNRLSINIAGARLILEYYEVKLRDGKSRFIVFQDSIKDDGLSTDEYQKGLSLIDKTIKYKL